LIEGPADDVIPSQGYFLALGQRGPARPGGPRPRFPSRHHGGRRGARRHAPDGHGRPRGARPSASRRLISSRSTTAGKQHRLSDFAGKFVVLEWTNPGCPFVRKHYGSGNMPATQKAATAKGAIWLAVNSTSAPHATT